MFEGEFLILHTHTHTHNEKTSCLLCFRKQLKEYLPANILKFDQKSINKVVRSESTTSLSETSNQTTISATNSVLVASGSQSPITTETVSTLQICNNDKQTIKTSNDSRTTLLRNESTDSFNSFILNMSSPNPYTEGQTSLTPTLASATSSSSTEKQQLTSSFDSTSDLSSIKQQELQQKQIVESENAEKESELNRKSLNGTSNGHGNQVELIELSEPSKHQSPPTSPTIIKKAKLTVAETISVRLNGNKSNGAKVNTKRPLSTTVDIDNELIIEETSIKKKSKDSLNTSENTNEILDTLNTTHDLAKSKPTISLVSKPTVQVNFKK